MGSSWSGTWFPQGVSLSFSGVHTLVCWSDRLTVRAFLQERLQQLYVHFSGVMPSGITTDFESIGSNVMHCYLWYYC